VTRFHLARALRLKGSIQAEDLVAAIELLRLDAEVLAAEPRMGPMALHRPAQSGNANVVGLLLDHGAFSDQQFPVLGNTPLMVAILHKHEEAVRLVLKYPTRLALENFLDRGAALRVDLAHDNVTRI
jgi:uncharacterized protein